MAFSKVSVSKLPLPPKEILPDIFAFPPNPDSFGGVSYLIRGESCSFMVDVPEYVEQNIRFIEENDPSEFIFLTHRDDVADAEMFREKFGAALIIQESEKYAVKLPDLTFKDSLEIRDAQIIHTPGHSPGSSCLLYSKRGIMFTGDHVVVCNGKLAVEDFSWTYDYAKQIESANKLLCYEFEYMLCGHGGRRLIQNAKQELIKFLKDYSREFQNG